MSCGPPAPGPVVLRSSAVPVLPATVMPGICAEVPVPNSTTATIIRCTRLATRRLVTRTKWGRWCARSVGIGRLPPIAMVAPTSVISSAVVWTIPCPIAEDPTARSSPIDLAGGILLSAAPGIEDGWLKPNRCAMSTSLRPPSFTPSGANTELHDTAKALRKVPPHASPPAFWSLKPSIVASVMIGKVSLSLTIPASSAPVAVMIFIVEPGGCSAENATPASARTAPVRGSIAAMPA